MTVRHDPTGRRDRAQERHEEWSQEHDEESDYRLDGENINTNELSYGEEVASHGSPRVYSSGKSPYASGVAKNMGSGIAGGSGLSEPPSQEAASHLQQLLQQGLPKEQILAQLKQHYGWTPSDADFAYAQQGLNAFNGPPGQYSLKYMNNPQGKAMSKAYGTPGFQQWMDQQQQVQDAKDMARGMKKNEQEAKVKMHMILLQIMMGDIAGALRSYAVLMDRDLRQFTRLLVKKLDGVRKARSMVIRNFARTKPPRAYSGQNPQTAARAQDKSARYTQFVQMSTQLMNELQNTERELTDALQSQFRNAETFWQTVATFRDETFRTNDRVMTMR
ncbi:MAG TPA: hypothetical protein DF383_12490 [Deltaproteobacteria bacterium]|nr:hypothetical protein [Deltaproteobacteria bacterium]